MRELRDQQTNAHKNYNLLWSCYHFLSGVRGEYDANHSGVEEIRDISVIRLKDGKWSQPRWVAQDGWRINGCPVNGPAVAASDRHVAVAWFTGAANTQQVKLAPK